MLHLLTPKKIPRQLGKPVSVDRKRHYWEIYITDTLQLGGGGNPLLRARHSVMCYAYIV